MEQNGNGKKQEHRMTTLEVKVDTILNNHLPHINKKLNWIMATGVTLLIGVIYILIETLLSHV